MSLIVNIFESFLGTIRSHNEGKSQVQFDCPACSEESGKYNGDGKGNLALNYEKGVFKCWSCWERNNMSGVIPKLINRYGDKSMLRDYYLLKPREVTDKTIDIKVVTELPTEFISLKEENSKRWRYKEAFEYLKSRNINMDSIHKYNLGYCASGDYNNRIIIPSYDINGNINYFVSRTFLAKAKSKYLNPEADKDYIIFNENKICWDATIYLVEGTFDHLVLPNSIPLLGKFISEKLFHNLQYKANADVVIVLDGDAIDDAILLYKQLNSFNLLNRVKIVFLNSKFDLSKINELFGFKGIYDTIKTAKQLKEHTI